MASNLKAYEGVLNLVVEKTKGMKAGYDKLKEENEKLKAEIKHKNEKFSEWCEENRALKEENEKLNNTIITMDYQIDRLKGENKKKGAWDDIGEMFMSKANELKEENKILQQFKSAVIEAMNFDDDIDDVDIIRGIRNMEEDIVGECELKEQIEILTTERNDLITRIEDLKEEMEMWKASYDDDIREARAEGIDDC